MATLLVVSQKGALQFIMTSNPLPGYISPNARQSGSNNTQSANNTAGSHNSRNNNVPIFNVYASSTGERDHQYHYKAASLLDLRHRSWGAKWKWLQITTGGVVIIVTVLTIVLLTQLPLRHHDMSGQGSNPSIDVTPEIPFHYCLTYSCHILDCNVRSNA